MINKFIAWDKVNKRMMPSFTIQDCVDGLNTPFNCECIAGLDKEVYDVFQYTGKNDKNGNPIIVPLHNVLGEKEKVIMTGAIPQCPYCKKPTRRTGGAGSVTCAYYAPVYDEQGNNTNPDRNTITSNYSCYECGNNYSTAGNYTETSNTAETKALNNAPIGRSIFLIKKIWFDSMENEVGSAVGYSPFGFVDTEDEAKIFCEKGRICTKKDCWAVYGEKKEYKYLEVKYCGQQLG